MKITALEVQGFGIWSGLRITELNDPLVVLYGPNEAGKTTLMQFVRAVLYGFSSERRARYLPPVAGGRAGGWLRVEHEGRGLTLRRSGEGDDPAGELALLDRHGVELDDVRLGDLLGEIDEPVFNHVFALGLREIQELGTLSDTEAAHLFYDLSLGLDRVSLVDVLRELAASRNRLLAADERPSLIVQLLGQREQLQGEIDELHALTPQYIELLQARRQVERDIEQGQEQHDAAARRLRIFELARSLTERWRGRALLDQQRAALGPVVSLPAGALERLNRLTERITARREHLSELKRQSEQLRGEADALVINEKLCRQGPRLEALSEQQQWIASLAGQVQQLEAEIAQLDGERKAGDERWGLTSPGRSGPPQDPARHMPQLTAAAKSLAQARRAYRQAKAKTDQGRQAAGEISGRIESSLGKRVDDGLDKALDRAGTLVSQLRRRVQLDQRLDQMSRRQTELEEQGRDWLERQVLPMWQAVGVGFLFILGCGLILLYTAGLVLPESMTGSLHWPVGLVGIVLAGGGGLAKMLLERFASDKLDASHLQLGTLRDQFEYAKRERDALDQQLPRGGGALVSRLQAAEKELASLEELLPVESQRKTASREARAARNEKRAAGAEYKKAQGRWRSALAAAGLPETLRPKQLGDYRRHGEQTRELAKRLEGRRQELTDRRREYGTLTSRIAQLVSEAGLKSASTEPLAQLREMLAALQEHDGRWKRRESLLEQVSRLRRKKNRSDRAMDKLRQHRSLLLREADTTDEAEFRRLAAAEQEAQRLETARRQLTQEIAASLAGQCDEAAIEQYLESSQNLDRTGEELQVSLGQIKTRLAQLFERRGELNQQTKTLLEDRRPEHKQIELGLVEQRLRDALSRWRVLAVCDVALERVRSLYERDHQPAVLREASGYLERLTGGRYRRVWTPLGEHVLRVDDAEGRALPVEVLSRGTREQLFLSLRLALVNAYAARGVRLPLVLDDVLVNFDATRSKAAAAVLRDFAKGGHQLLIFTCHEHIARMFKSLKAEVRELPDNVRSPQAVVEVEVQVEEPPKRVRRPRPEPEPEPMPVVVVQAVVELEEEPVAKPTSEPEREPELVPIATVSEIIVQGPLAAALPTITIAPPRIEIVAPLEPVPPVEPVYVDPPHPPVAPPRRSRRLIRERIERNRWSAEEFDGELADRVRRVEVSELEDVSDAGAA